MCPFIVHEYCGYVNRCNGSRRASMARPPRRPRAGRVFALDSYGYRAGFRMAVAPSGAVAVEGVFMNRDCGPEGNGWSSRTGDVDGFGLWPCTVGPGPPFARDLFFTLFTRGFGQTIRLSDRQSCVGRRAQTFGALPVRSGCDGQRSGRRAPGQRWRANRAGSPALRLKSMSGAGPSS